MLAPTLSVVLPNYNDAGYIQESLEAILAQSFTPHEIIVVDDASTDDSVERIEEIARRSTLVRLVKNRQNLGVVGTLNRGIEQASGNFIFMPSADDKVLPGFFEKCMGMLSQYPHAGFCHSDLLTFDGRARRFYLSRTPCHLTPDAITERLGRMRSLAAGGGNSIVKRSALIDEGGLSPGLRWHSDSFVFMVIALRHGLCYVPEPLVMVRVQATSYSRANRRRWVAQREVQGQLLKTLESETYRDVMERVRKASSWPLNEFSMVRVLLKQRRQEYLSSRLLRRAVCYGLWDMAQRVAPLAVQRVYCTLLTEWRKRFPGRPESVGRVAG